MKNNSFEFLFKHDDIKIITYEIREEIRNFIIIFKLLNSYIIKNNFLVENEQLQCALQINN